MVNIPGDTANYIQLSIDVTSRGGKGDQPLNGLVAIDDILLDTDTICPDNDDDLHMELTPRTTAAVKARKEESDSATIEVATSRPKAKLSIINIG